MPRTIEAQSEHTYPGGIRKEDYFAKLTDPKAQAIFNALLWLGCKTMAESFANNRMRETKYDGLLRFIATEISTLEKNRPEVAQQVRQFLPRS